MEFLVDAFSQFTADPSTRARSSILAAHTPSDPEGLPAILARFLHGAGHTFVMSENLQNVAPVASIDKPRGVALRSQIQPTREIPMPDRESDFSDRSYLRRMALSRWENEGGAWCGHVDAASLSSQGKSDVPPLTNAELVQLQIRVIALENLVIALLTDASDRQLGLVRDMAAYIRPRPGFTPHRLTIHAAAEMISLVERAGHFRDMPPS